MLSYYSSVENVFLCKERFYTPQTQMLGLVMDSADYDAISAYAYSNKSVSTPIQMCGCGSNARRCYDFGPTRELSATTGLTNVLSADDVDGLRTLHGGDCAAPRWIDR